MDFWMIFVCLLTGAVIGYEFGSYMATKRMREFLHKVGEDMKKTADDLQAKKEAADREAKQKLMDILSKYKEEKERMNDGQETEGHTADH